MFASPIYVGVLPPKYNNIMSECEYHNDVYIVLYNHIISQRSVCVRSYLTVLAVVVSTLTIFNILINFIIMTCGCCLWQTSMLSVAFQWVAMVVENFFLTSPVLPNWLQLLVTKMFGAVVITCYIPYIIHIQYCCDSFCYGYSLFL